MANEKVFISEYILGDISQAIYDKGGSTGGLAPVDFAEHIRNISTSSVPDMELNNGYVEAVYTASTKDLMLRNIT